MSDKAKNTPEGASANAVTPDCAVKLRERKNPNNNATLPPAEVARTSAEQILPKGSAHDAAHTWGDSNESRNHDEWLKENRPPHWE